MAPMFMPTTINIESDDDEGPKYRGGSSEDESQTTQRGDIKPSTFAPRPSGIDRFKDITSRSIFNPKQSSDVMANAYGGRVQRPPQKIKQAGPAKAQPIDLDLNDVEDFLLRKKIVEIRQVLPHQSVRTCLQALITSKANFNDAMEFLVQQEDRGNHVDLTLDEDALQLNKPPKRPPGQSLIPVPKKPTAKQQIKAPAKKIQEKWTTSQTLPKSQLSPVSTPPRPRRRLVQGRKRVSSPLTATSSKQSSPIPVSKAATPESEDLDSGIGSESDHPDVLEERVLRFLNACSSLDLADIAAIPEETATILLSQKPFKSLGEVRLISGGPLVKGGRKTTRKPIGDKIVDKCLNMWAGYEAVDELIHRCEDLAKPLKDEMMKWGVDLFGAANKEGELEIADFDSISRDSGIGTPIGSDEEGDLKSWTQKRKFFPQPSTLGKDITLKDYQVVGINWLSLLFEKQLSCILADDMGLGKTAQVVAFLAHLLEKGIKGPHLIIVPGSTLENWLREFSLFCPKLNVMPYYAGLKERPSIQEQISDNTDSVNVIVTTYGIAKVKDDNKFLRTLKPVCCVYDEGHYLRNSESAGYKEYMKINARFRLLLTGTPLQNNLRELASLLGFILPSVFAEHRGELEAIFSHKAKTTDADESHAALLSTQRIARAKSMMTPFVLRRKKHQVLKHLPQKHRRVEYCELSLSQEDLYTMNQARVSRLMASREAGEKTGNETANIMMDLRKASIHPLLSRRLYDDETIAKMSKACLREDAYAESNVDLVFEDMTVMTDMELQRFCENHPKTMTPFRLVNDEWMDSGKVKVLSELLKKYKANGDRVLVFSQFVMVMDILEAVMETLDMRYFRLDGSTKIDERQDMIDQFYKEPEITVFLLSTKAGGAGINLACANKVVIFDSSFNPQVCSTPPYHFAILTALRMTSKPRTALIELAKPVRWK